MCWIDPTSKISLERLLQVPARSNRIISQSACHPSQSAAKDTLQASNVTEVGRHWQLLYSVQCRYENLLIDGYLGCKHCGMRSYHYIDITIISTYLGLVVIVLE